MFRKNNVMRPDSCTWRDGRRRSQQVLKKRMGFAGRNFAKREPQEIALKAGRKAVTYTFARMLPHLGLSYRCPHPVSLRRGAGHRVGVTAETRCQQNLVRLLLQLIERGEKQSSLCRPGSTLGVRFLRLAGRVDEDRYAAPTNLPLRGSSATHTPC